MISLFKNTISYEYLWNLYGLLNFLTTFPYGWWLTLWSLWYMQFLKEIFKVWNFDLHFECWHTSYILYKHLQMGCTMFFCFQQIQTKICMYVYINTLKICCEKWHTNRRVNKNEYVLEGINYLKERIHVTITWSKKL